MKKTERLSTAKALVLAMANREPFDSWLDKDKTLKAEGCTLSENKGERAYTFTDTDGKKTVLVPKKKTVNAYDPQDWRRYRKLTVDLANAVTKEQVYEVSKKVGGIKAKSLKSEVEKGIEFCIDRIRNGYALPEEVQAHKVETPKKDETIAHVDERGKTTVIAEVRHVDITDKPSKTAAKKYEKVEVLPKEEQHAEVCRLALELDGKVEFKQKREGACFWASGDVKAHKNALKRAGFVWSRKRQAYYWKPVITVAA